MECCQERSELFSEKLLRVLRWIPVLMVLGIMVWATVIYIIDIFLCYDGCAQFYVYLISFSVAFVPLYWSFYRVVTTKSYYIPEKFLLPDYIYRRLVDAETIRDCHCILKDFVYCRDLPIVNFNLNNSIRYCEKCRMVKPDRCHHCTTCKSCILKMDHHCPWINNCVSFANYKFFILFLFYIIVCCVYIISTTYIDAYSFWNAGELHGIHFQIVAMILMAILLSFSTVTLLLYHCYLLLINETTIESIRKPYFKPCSNIKSFNVGVKDNFVEVFGKNPLLWLLPVYTTIGDGVYFPVSYRKCDEQPLMPC